MCVRKLFGDGEPSEQRMLCFYRLCDFCISPFDPKLVFEVMEKEIREGLPRAMRHPMADCDEARAAHLRGDDRTATPLLPFSLELQKLVLLERRGQLGIARTDWHTRMGGNLYLAVAMLIFLAASTWTRLVSTYLCHPAKLVEQFVCHHGQN